MPSGDTLDNAPASENSATHSGRVAIQKCPLARITPGISPLSTAMNLFRLEGAPRPVDEGRRHSVLLGLGHMIGEAVELLGPHRMLVGLLEVEEPGIRGSRRRARPKNSSR